MKRKEIFKRVGICALILGGATATLAGHDDATCKPVWDGLCGNGGKVYKTDAFKYVSPTTKRLNVLIYGDSISIMYTSQARAELEGKATLFRLFKNGGSSHNFISNMNEMEDAMFQPGLENGWDFSWDLIHFNVGLHDLKKTKGKKVSSIEVYKTNLDEICQYLKTKFPKAKLIFATTTAVPAGANKGRKQGDSITYNQAALEVLANYPEIVINDLYSFTLPQAKEWAQAPGDVHYNETGFTAQGVEVARVIAGNL